MTWYWWLLLLVVMYGLGMLGTLAFQKTHPPDRRVADRRQGDRRHARSGVPPGIDRRSGDRRIADRRRPKPLWQMSTVVVAAALLSIIGVVSYAESQVGSIFVEQAPQLIGSGWADCDTPVTWSMDTGRLTSADAKVAVTQMTGDFAKWGEASGLTFQYVGELPVNYDDATLTVTSDSHPSDRHIYVAFLNNADSSLLDSRTVGFASPSKVFVESKEIVEGSVVLSIEYVKKASRLQESSLYLHELGHALGLGHGTSEANVMYYIVDTNNELSPGDVEGIRALVKACKDGA